MGRDLLSHTGGVHGGFQVTYGEDGIFHFLAEGSNRLSVAAGIQHPAQGVPNSLLKFDVGDPGDMRSRAKDISAGNAEAAPRG